MPNYPVAIEPGDETTAYGVVVPDLPGCFSAGESIEEALEKTKEVIAGHLVLLCKDGQRPPAPSSAEVYADRPEFEGFIWAVVSVG